MVADVEVTTVNPLRGNVPVATLRPDPMRGWHEIESMIRRMRPGLLRAQMVDVLKANYSDALDEAVGVTDDA